MVTKTVPHHDDSVKAVIPWLPYFAGGFCSSAGLMNSVHGFCHLAHLNRERPYGVQR